MVKPSGFDKNGIKKGAWSEDEDDKLRAYIQRYGHWNWSLLPKFAGLSRGGKSCRLRWVNYLRPNIKHGNFSKEEDDMIVHLHNKLGNKWSAMAANLPGRSDNEIKNRWHTNLKTQVQNDRTMSITDHLGTTRRSADQVKQQENQKLELPNQGEMNLAEVSSDSPSCSTLTELSSCRWSGSNCGVSSNVASQTSSYQLNEDFWTEPFLEDITSSVDNILLPLNVDDDLIGQPSCKNMTMNDEFSWAMFDSYGEYNSEFISYWDADLEALVTDTAKDGETRGWKTTWRQDGDLEASRKWIKDEDHICGCLSFDMFGLLIGSKSN
ncbi:hypothetical protein SSX86_016374 [Deinandra increscens subsp. villosa]|uniref:Uncharacterized protein n=1 Tax=Deinandra increscens subsp. villosa TaxID=3103831 RepID=A0AAP0CXU9_9ASTR